jgi:hypothetical protein
MCPVRCVTYVSGRSRESRLPNEQRTAEVAKRPAEDLANQARYLDQLGRHGSQFIDEIRYRRGIRLPARGTDGIFAYHNSGGSKELDGCRMARNRSESSIPCN